MIKIGQILNRWGPSIRVVPYNIKNNVYETITVAIDEILCLKNEGRYQKKMENNNLGLLRPVYVSYTNSHDSFRKRTE